MGKQYFVVQGDDEYEELENVAIRCRLEKGLLSVPPCRFDAETTRRKVKTIYVAQMVRLAMLEHSVDRCTFLRASFMRQILTCFGSAWPLPCQPVFTCVLWEYLSIRSSLTGDEGRSYLRTYRIEIAATNLHTYSSFLYRVLYRVSKERHVAPTCILHHRSLLKTWSPSFLLATPVFLC